MGNRTEKSRKIQNKKDSNLSELDEISTRVEITTKIQNQAPKKKSKF
jgi:hypothetical protein